MKHATRVVVVDGRQGFLDAVALVLAHEDAIDLVGAARTVRDALARRLVRGCDVIAVGLGDGVRVEDLAAVRDEAPDLGILVIAFCRAWARPPIGYLVDLSLSTTAA